jgi:hypothetical protein
MPFFSKIALPVAVDCGRDARAISWKGASHLSDLRRSTQKEGSTMNQDRHEQVAESREKLPYAQPKLSKHGKVENLTQAAPPNGVSQPPITEP